MPRLSAASMTKALLYSESIVQNYGTNLASIKFLSYLLIKRDFQFCSELNVSGSRGVTDVGLRYLCLGGKKEEEISRFKQLFIT